MNHGEPNELVVFDECNDCPYLPGRVARMPLRWPDRRLTGDQLERRLAAGDRRSGLYLYHTQCPDCVACEPIRVPVDEFLPSRTQRRVWRRGQRLLTVEVGEPSVDQQRIDLFNAHRRDRGLEGRDGDIDRFGYTAFLVQSCCETREIRYRHDNRLVAVALTDVAANSLNAVYCYFDPNFGWLSPGTFSILQQIELCRQYELRYLYLGLYIAESPHMSYKASYLPHERRIDGAWRRFETRAMAEKL